MLDTTCPRCGAPHARRLAVIYQEGRTLVQNTVNTVGRTNTINQVKITTQGTLHGVAQNDASRAAAPPYIPPLKSNAAAARSIIIGASFVLGFIVPIYMFIVGAGFLVSMGVALVILIGGVVIGAMQGDEATPEEIAEHKEKYKDAYEAVERWKHTFSCGSCGHRFIPSEQAQESDGKALHPA